MHEIYARGAANNCGWVIDWGGASEEIDGRFGEYGCGGVCPTPQFCFICLSLIVMISGFGEVMSGFDEVKGRPVVSGMGDKAGESVGGVRVARTAPSRLLWARSDRFGSL